MPVLYNVMYRVSLIEDKRGYVYTSMYIPYDQILYMIIVIIFFGQNLQIIDHDVGCPDLESWDPDCVDPTKLLRIPRQVLIHPALKT